MTEEFDKMTLAQLKEAAKVKGIVLSASMRKNDIVQLMRDSDDVLDKNSTDSQYNTNTDKNESMKNKNDAPNEKVKKIPKAVSTPEQSVMETAAKEHTVKEHAVKEHAVKEHAVKEHAVKEHAVKEHTSKEHAVKEHVSKEKTAAEKAGDKKPQEAKKIHPKDNRLAEKKAAESEKITEEAQSKKNTAVVEESEPTKVNADTVKESEAPKVNTETVEKTESTQVNTETAEKSEQPQSGRTYRKEENGSSDYRQQPQKHRNEGRRPEIEHLDSGEIKEGILEIMPDGYGFIRCDNFLPGENDVYVAPAQIRKLNLKTGDIIVGNTKIKSQTEKFSALLFVKSVNGRHPSEAVHRKRFEDLTPIYPNERIHLEMPGCCVSMRMVDIISPIGKGQRGMIVSQPKAGKTTLLKQIAKAITTNHKEIHLIILLIDERPEEVTDMKESIEGENVEVIYSTFDEEPDNHRRVSEMVIERAKRLVEFKKDVVILLDSITRLSRAYNLTVQSSGRTLSGGLDPAALHMPKRFFGAARNMREGGSLTILATALVETGSRMDDVVFEEFKGTGNMELVLDRNLSERRIFPAIDLPKSSTRREDLLLTQAEIEANYLMRRALNSIKSDDAVERIINMFTQTKNNEEFIEMIKKTRLV